MSCTVAARLTIKRMAEQRAMATNSFASSPFNLFYRLLKSHSDRQLGKICTSDHHAVHLPPCALTLPQRVVLYATSDLSINFKRKKQLFEAFKTSFSVSEKQGSICTFKSLHIFQKTVSTSILLTSTQSWNSKPMSQTTMQSQEQKINNLSFPPFYPHT